MHPLSTFQEGSPLARGVASDQFIEKSFLYLLLLSVIVHLGAFAAWYFWPHQKPQLSEPTFIDLQDMPELKSPVPAQEPLQPRPSDRRRRVAKEMAPRIPQPAARPVPPSQRSARTQTSPAPGRRGSPGAVARPAAPQSGSVGELLRRKPQAQSGDGGGGGVRQQPNLMPSASRMARLEENYRRRFADDIDEGTTRFLNTDDIQFGSFLRRFETAVYGVWRYPQEAALKGIEGVTPVKITFNRQGEIVKVQLLDSSGSRILDDEVFRTLRLIGPMGNLPRAYGKDEFNLIAFFQYGNARGRLR